ncbi:DNA polymerase III subunit alpha [Alkalicella caledoniensis]|uniref:DNA polymerase III subunit alpha n=1 Tax=Alkalicella caledoniensis TaxID=2731377 RepID=A0A7G9WAD6_ALKCA|nr:DNA polymerase III subunit alpha [Alkalicella caledoniensis]QNO15648.1 DNA polymerase III subunit alpha [Alkalicella caledoniensis]
MENFVHLHVHTEYSLLDGAAKIKDVVAKAKELGQPAIAITDHGTMYGVIDFYKECKKQGVKPIIGCEVYVAAGSRFSKEGRRDDNSYHLVLLAKDNEGYKNLMKLVSLGYTEGFYYKPRVDMELLQKYSHGLICLSACLGGEIPQYILQNRNEEALECTQKLLSFFGRDNFYMELQDHGLMEQKQVNAKLIEIANKLDIQMVVTNDIHYTSRVDSGPHDVLLCIQTAKNIDETGRMKFPNDEFYMKSRGELEHSFAHQKKALDNTVDIANKCNVDFDFDTTHLPQYPVPEGETLDSYLEKLCVEGIKYRYSDIKPQILERLDMELSVIKNMGYSGYFLIVWDFIKFARENDILVGPGRGSAAGSIVAYSLGITNIDPLKYDLLFERFLNPERVSMPDIDIDFCYERREEVINYVVEKYGEDKVAQIITFGTMAARAVVRDVGRALGIPYSDVDKIAKLIPMELNMTIDKALKVEPTLKLLYNEDETIKKLLDVSLSLEGMPRHSSTHAAGVVISKEPLTEYVPLQTVENGVVTQFPMGTLEELGLLKMDFLGLRTLTIINNAVKIIESTHNKKIDIDTVSYDDEKTYNLLSEGKTLGVFQLESSGMRNVLRELKPTKFEEIIAVVALYRPGPMEQIPTFIKSKHKQIPISYPHEKVKSVLEETYGIMVYQEQIMRVASDLAGFSLGESDILRRAIGKKKSEVLAEQRKIFMEGCLKNGLDEKLAEHVYDLIVKFADYGFNKSHAAAYAVLAYQTAYLKANYPTEFLAAMLTGVMGSSDKVALYIDDCKNLNIQILPPDINESLKNFTVVDVEKIRFGLLAVKNVGANIIDDIIKERQKNGPFKTMDDFVSRIYNLNRRVLESLIKAGAFDTLNSNRAQLLSCIDMIINYGESIRREKESGQMSLFDIIADTNEQELVLPDLPAFSSKDQLALEKETLGLYISGHPLNDYLDIYTKGVINTLELKELPDNQRVKIAGTVSSCKKIFTKAGKPMAFIELEDMYGVVEVVVFTDQYERHLDKLISDEPIIVLGRVSLKEEEDPKIVCQEIYGITEDFRLYKKREKPSSNLFVKEEVAAVDMPKKIFLKLVFQEELIAKLNRVIEIAHGDSEVFFYISDKGKVIKAHTKVNVTETLLDCFGELVGKENVKVT